MWEKMKKASKKTKTSPDAGGKVTSTYSNDGYRLTCSEENDVVVSDDVSGFEVHGLKGHRCHNK